VANVGIISCTVLPLLIAWIGQRWLEHQPATFKQIRESIFDTWAIGIIQDTLTHIIGRIPELRSCKALPMEVARMHVPDEKICNWFRLLMDLVQDVACCLVYNVNELGHEEYADRKEKQCVVPSHVQGEVYYEEIHSQGKAYGNNNKK
jgi:hypothetical protein